MPHNLCHSYQLCQSKPFLADFDLIKIMRRKQNLQPCIKEPFERGRMNYNDAGSAQRLLTEESAMLWLPNLSQHPISFLDKHYCCSC